jgi:dTDP-4-amino-4,6-dideoxygalactose transaminase
VVIDSTEAGFTRNDLAAFLAENNIDSRRYFHPPVHRQHIFHPHYKVTQRLPVTQFVTENILSLPLYSHQKVSEVDRVIRTIKQCYRKYHGPIK